MSRPAWFMPPRPVLLLPVLLVLALPVRPAQATLFRLPLDRPEEIWVDWVIHADHDPSDGGLLGADCLAFDGSTGFPFCYDGHDGTDYLLYDNWDAMDEERVTVLAAAEGWVTSVADGNYDRCHADLGSQDVSCDGHAMIGNHVKIRHADGMQSWYWHFKKDTILVRVGDFVDCGDPLGFVGSSGYSTGPHLHFEVRTAQDEWLDPYAGPISQPESYWVQQVGPFGLPGPYCEGDEIPIEPEPDPEMAGEDVATVPDVAEDVLPDPGVHDAGSDEDAEPAGDDGQPTDAQDVGLAADPGGPGDEGAPRDAATGGFDRFGGLPGESGWGCAASGGGAPGTMPFVFMLLVLAILRSRRRA
mgnify:CR=1 FL=1